MRGSSWVALSILLAGCLGAKPAAESPEPQPAEVLLLDIVDLESRPVANATVLLSGINRTGTSDARGRVAFADVRAGRVELNASAPGYYYNHTFIQVDNLSVPQQVALAEKPEYIAGNVPPTVFPTGNDNGKRACDYQNLPPLATDPTCRSRGARWGVGPYMGTIDVEIQWERHPTAPEALRFELTVEGKNGTALAFADGITNRSLEGPGPVLFAIDLTLITEQMRAGPGTIQIMPWPPRDSDVPPVFQQEFSVDAWVEYYLPPPERACDLHPIPCE